MALRNGRGNQKGFVQKRSTIQENSDGVSLADRAVEPYWHTTKREAPRSVSTSQIGAFQLSTAGVMLLADEDFYKIVDCDQRDLEGQPLDESGLDRELSEKILEIKDASLAHGNQDTEIRVSQHPDSNRFYKIRTHVHGKGENDRGEISIKVFIEDVTESRTVHSHLMQAQKLSSLSNVVSGLAHTFNNSLTTIIGQASFASAQKDPDKTIDALQKVIDTAQKSSELIWKLIEFCESKPEQLKSNDLGTLLKGNQELLQKIAGEQHSLEFSLQNDGSPILCDESLLIQALSNLIINAKEAYGTQKGEIEISLDTETLDQTAASLVAGSRPGTYARLRVKDSGSGMTNDVVARACEPLFSTRHGSGQAGLGLAMVFSIARAHDGFLTIESQSGKGTSVTLYLPLDEATEVEVPTEETKKSVPAINALRESVNHERILVVEDEPSVRSLVEKMLSSLGYEVLACCDGEEALEKFQQGTFDLVLVDMMMPKMNGPELLKLLQEKNSETRALIMTGYGIKGVPEDTLATVLPKPFDMQTLASTVYEALHSV
jgi:signal transduction histidine kinase